MNHIIIITAAIIVIALAVPVGAEGGTRFAYQCSNCDRVEYWTSPIDPKKMACIKCYYDEDAKYHMVYLGALGCGDLFTQGSITSDKQIDPLQARIAKLEAELQHITALVYSIHGTETPPRHWTDDGIDGSILFEYEPLQRLYP